MTHSRRGVTLIELLVATGAMVLVMGLALGVAMESEKATRSIARQQAALMYAQGAMERAIAVVGSAVDPANLSVPNLQPQLQFQHDQLTLATFNTDQEPALRLVTLRNKPASGEKGLEVERHSQVLNPATGQVGQETHEPLLRQSNDRFEPIPSISFAYSGAPDAGQSVNWQDSWSGPGYPRLIQITVQAAIRDDRTTRSVKLQTAVIPGLVGGV